MGMTDPEKRALKGGSASIEAIAVLIPEAERISGLSRTKIYKELAAGHLEAVKHGNRTLILVESIRARLASLPRATFRAT